MLALLAAKATLAAAVIAMPNVAYASPSPEGAAPSAHERVIAAVKEYDRQGKTDYVALNAAIVAAGGTPVKFSTAGSGLTGLSPEQAQAVYDQDQRTIATRERAVGLQVIEPSDFKVTGSWTQVVDQDGHFYVFFGNWEFTSADNSSDPLDAFGVMTKSNNAACNIHHDDDAWAFDAWGDDVSDRISRRDAEGGKVVWQVRDNPNVANVWRGSGYISFQHLQIPNKSCSTRFEGVASYEHNRGGCNCTWSLGFTALGFNIGYSSGSQPEALKQSTKVLGYHAES